MAQKTVTTPVKSPLSSPYQAPLPTALKGRSSPQITTVTAHVQRTINGMQNELWTPNEIYGFGNVGSSDVLNSSGGIGVKAWTSLLDYATKGWKLFQQCVDTYTDTSDPTQNYVCTSSISGGGQTPQSSGYPGGSIFWPYPFSASPGDWDVGSGEWQIASGTRTMDRVFSSPVDVGSYFNTMKSDMLALALGNSGTYNDYHYAGPGLDVTGVSPSTYSGALVTASGSPSFGPTGAAVTCGWTATTFSTFYAGMEVQRQKATLTGGSYYFWVGLWEEGISNSIGAVVTRITFISDGFINSGESIGLAGDGATHVISMPTDPFPLQAMGANVVVKRFVFAVIGRSPAAYLPGLGLHMGDNY